MILPSLKNHQLKLFNDINLDELKAGDFHCQACHQKMIATAYRMTDRYTIWAYKALDWCYQNKSFWSFDVKAVFTPDEQNGQAQRGIPTQAAYLGLVRSIKRRPNWWEFTMTGRRFLAKKIAIPSAVWVYEKQIVAVDENYVHVDAVDHEWRRHADYLLDYILVPYPHLLKKVEKQDPNQGRMSL